MGRTWTSRCARRADYWSRILRDGRFRSSFLIPKAFCLRRAPRGPGRPVNGRWNWGRLAAGGGLLLLHSPGSGAGYASGMGATPDFVAAELPVSGGGRGAAVAGEQGSMKERMKAKCQRPKPELPLKDPLLN